METVDQHRSFQYPLRSIRCEIPHRLESGTKSSLQECGNLSLVDALRLIVICNVPKKIIFVRGVWLLQTRAILAYFVRKFDYSYLLITFKSGDRKPTRILLTSRVLTCILSRKIVISLRSLSFECELVRSCIISLLGCKKYYYCFFDKLD